MSSFQRRRGQSATIYMTKDVTDSRGNTQRQIDQASATDVVAVFTPERSARAEVPGQQQVNVVKMIVSPELEGLDLWARVEWDGKEWDVVSPPSYHHGTRHTRHYSLLLRQRP